MNACGDGLDFAAWINESAAVNVSCHCRELILPTGIHFNFPILVSLGET